MPIGTGAHASAAASGTTVTTPSRTSTGGPGTVFTALIAWAASGSPSTPSSVPDSKSNTYSQVGSTLVYSADNNIKAALYRCIGGTGGASHTFTANFGAAQDVLSVWWHETTGGDTSSITDQAPAGAEDGLSPYASSSATTTQANELLVTLTATINVSGTEAITWGNSFVSTGDDITNASSFITGSMATRSVSATGTYSSSFTATGAGTFAALTFLITYKEAAAAGLSPPPEGGAQRLLKQSAAYRMSPRSQSEAQQFLRAQKRAYGFAAAA